MSASVYVDPKRTTAETPNVSGNIAILAASDGVEGKNTLKFKFAFATGVRARSTTAQGGIPL
jgi:hypothetical protein